MPKAQLILFEKVRRRIINITAESVTVGSLDSADVRLENTKKSFLIEIKFSGGSWWLLNPLRNSKIFLNEKPVSLEAKLSDKDEILAEGFRLTFESSAQKKKDFSFISQPSSDEALWKYLLEENEFDEILINGSNNIYVDYRGSLQLAPWKFSSDHFLTEKIHKSARAQSGWASWRLNRLLRFQAALPPLVENPHISIRKAKKFALSFEQLTENKFGSLDQMDFIKHALTEKQNILISGGTSTGKTVLLRSLVELMDPGERIVLLEEEAEIDWPHPHLVSIECGRGNLAHAIVESLRMRPNRLIVSEVRGQEAFEMLQAMNTGHSGSISTVHANSPRDAITRLETLILSTGTQTTVSAARRMIAQSINIIIQLERNSDGERFISGISRLSGIQNDTLLFADPLATEGRGLKQRISPIHAKDR